MAKSIQEKMVEAAAYLNSLETIEPGNKTIWENYLHRWDNAEWVKIFSILLELSNDNPKLLREHQKNQLMKARTKFITSTSKSNRIMDTKEHKKDAWGMLMLIKEVFNAVHEEANIKDSGQMTLRPPKKKDHKELGHEHIAWNQPNVTTEVYPDRTVITIYHTEINNG